MSGNGTTSDDESTDKTTSEEIISYPTAVFWFLKQILFVTGSFDFSWGLVFLTILIGHIQASNDEANPLAVAPLALTLFETAIVTFMSVYFGLSQELSPRFQQLADSTKESNHLQLRHEMSSLYKAGLFLSLLLSAAVVLPSLYSERILIALGQEPEIAAAAQRFSRILAISVVPLLTRFLTEQFFMSANKFKVPMMIAGPNLIIGTGLGAWLAFGSPQWGLEGIGLGFVISAVLSAIGFTAYAKLAAPFSKIPFYTEWDFKSIFTQLLKILKNGLAFMLQYAFELPASFILSTFAGQLGEDQLASWNSVQGLIYVTKLFQIASGVTALNRFGAENTRSPLNALLEVKASVIASYILAAPFCITTLIRPDLAVLLFSNTASPAVEAMATKLLRIVSAGLLFSAPNIIFMFAPKIKGDLWKPHAITIGSVWAGVASGWVLANQTELGVNGLAIGFAAGTVGATMGNGFRFFRTINSTPAATLLDIQGITPAKKQGRCFGLFDGCCDQKPDPESPGETTSLLRTPDSQT